MVEKKDTLARINPRESEIDLFKETFKIQLDTVRKYFCASATDSEIGLFLEIAKSAKLNPFLREIYLVKYGAYPASNLIGYEVYLKRAEKNPDYQGFFVKTEGSVKDGDLRAIITVRRKNWPEPLVHEVLYSEYVKKTKEGKINDFWQSKPITLIKKVAMAQGHRLAFPNECGGLPYIKEEFDAELTKDNFPDEIPAGKPEVEPARALPPDLKEAVEASATILDENIDDDPEDNQPGANEFNPNEFEPAPEQPKSTEKPAPVKKEAPKVEPIAKPAASPTTSDLKASEAKAAPTAPKFVTVKTISLYTVGDKINIKGLLKGHRVFGPYQKKDGSGEEFFKTSYLVYDEKTGQEVFIMKFGPFHDVLVKGEAIYCVGVKVGEYPEGSGKLQYQADNVMSQREYDEALMEQAAANG